MGIQGLGGVGKSTLAAYFYHSLEFEAKFWADVRDNPDFIVFAEKIIIALGGKGTFSKNIAELINNLLRLLSQHSCLLVVDNLETLLDKERNWQNESYQKFFSRWLEQGTNSTIFLTTQDKPRLLDNLENWYSLTGMKIEEGINLLTKEKIIGTDLELRNFVKNVDGHPLTIKLVAGYLRKHYRNQLSEVKKLDLEQFELVFNRAKGTHRNKQNTRLSWIIQKHLDRLSDKQKEFLKDLSIYRLPFNLEAAQYMWKDKKVKKYIIQEELQELCDRSLLIENQNNKYQFQSLIQNYIHQQDNDLTNAHQQAIKYYKSHFKKEQSWENLADVSEYLEIVEHYCQLEQYTGADNYLNKCSNFLFLRGYYVILVEIYGKLVQGWQLKLKLEDKSIYASAQNKLGNAFFHIGEYESAINCYQQSLKISQEINDVIGKANCFNNLGNIYSYRGEYEIAINYLNQSLNITQNIDSVTSEQIEKYKYIEANSLNNLGNIYNNKREYQTAINYIKKSLKISKEIKDYKTMAHSFNNLGIAYKDLKRYKTAINCYQKHLIITRKIGDYNEQARCFNNLGDLYTLLNDYTQAIDYLQKSLEIKREIGDRNGASYSLSTLGDVHLYLKDYRKALDFYQESLEITQDTGDLRVKAYSLIGSGIAYYSLEEYQQAINFLQQSLEIFQHIRDRNGEANSWFKLGMSWKKLHQKSKAKTAYKNAKKLYQVMELDKDVDKCNKIIESLEKEKNQ